ncbi:MAG: mechanosensitive ion channel family protein [Gammaproteobacteria bacterium]
MLELDFLNQTFFNTPLREWLIAVTTVLLVFVLLRLVKRIAANRLTVLAEKTETHWDNAVVDAIKQTKTVFLLVTSLYLGSLFLQLPDRVQSIFQILFIIVLLLQSGIWLTAITTTVMEQYRQRALERNPAAATSITAIAFVSKILIWSVLVLVALDSTGININTVVAGLGIGGVAVALALQNILGDLFASLSIILDKPFVIGDFIILNDYLGRVEYIGLKTTRVRSLSGEQIVFSNSDLLSSRIRNYGRMFERRVAFILGVTYDTPRDKLRRIPEIIRDAIDAQDNTRFDRSHFMKYGDFALQFETVYYVLSPDYNIYMDIQQSINLMIHEAFETEQISFAYPTQTLYVSQASAR